VVDKTPLRVLFSMRNFWYVRIFEPVIRALAARGHAVHILAEQGEQKEMARDWNDAAARLAAAYPNITFAWAPTRIDDDWIDLRIMIRLGLDHLRFLKPEYARAPKLASRARVRTPPFIVRLADAPVCRTWWGRRLLATVLRAMERATPIDPDVAGYFESHPTDVILVTPLLTLGSEQQDIIRIARRLAVPTALCVGSWDHLSSKALIREVPDKVVVWNETQKHEAALYHGIPPERVVVTGAQCFDEWFDRRPTLLRDDFCRKVGLDPARPYILYVCSALFEGSPSEAEFVRKWIARVRSSDDPRLRDAGILVRPHPKRGFEWDHVDLRDLDNVAIWPPRGAAPFDAATKSDYFDSMYHSAVTVGLNTSALIEAGIVGRAVHTVLLPEFYENQEGTLHFRYLLEGGLLLQARDLDTHVAQVAESLAAADSSTHHNRSFVERFVRPHGLGTAATPAFADAVEDVATLRVRKVGQPFWIPVLRALMTPLARHTSGTFAEQVNRKRRRRDKALAKTERATNLETHRAAEKARILEERQRHREEAMRERREREERVRAERLAVKREALEAKKREKAEHMKRWRGEKRHRAFNNRIAAYYRRLLKPFSTGR
jgi:hypothetical protein